MPGVAQPTAVPYISPRETDALDLEKRNIPTTPAQAYSSHFAKVIFYCTLNACVSAALIAFNKHLMHEGRFPYPGALAAMHMATGSLFVWLFYLFQRGCSASFGSEAGYFSTLPQALAAPAITAKVGAVAGLFGAHIILSNTAYLFSSVVFLQMMKEGNIPFVYAMSVVAGLEAMSGQKGQVLFFIVCATLLTIKGEVNFTWMGFAIQGSGQIFETLRIIFQALLLTGGRGLNLDVCTYLMLVLPASAIIICGVLVFNSYVFHVAAIAVPTTAVIVEWWPVLLGNSILGACLNVTTALTLKHASAIGLVLSGLMKDSAIIVVGACLLKENVSSMQVFGFSMQMMGIFAYSMIKLHPAKFQDGMYLGCKRILTKEADQMPRPLTDQDKTCYGT